jgi:hypothetical protein
VDIELSQPDLAAACFGHPPLPPGVPASKGPPQACVVGKINQFAAELGDRATSAFERLLAGVLAFQPFQCRGHDLVVSLAPLFCGQSRGERVAGQTFRSEEAASRGGASVRGALLPTRRSSLGLSPKADASGGRDEIDNHISSAPDRKFPWSPTHQPEFPAFLTLAPRRPGGEGRVRGAHLKQCAALPTSPPRNARPGGWPSGGSPAPRVKPEGLRLTLAPGSLPLRSKGRRGAWSWVHCRPDTQRPPPRCSLRPSRPGFAVVSGLPNVALPPCGLHRASEVRAPAR